MEIVTLLLVLTLLCSVFVAENRSGVNADADVHSRDAEWGLNDGANGEDDLTIISTADGNLHMVNADNGGVAWSAEIPGGALAKSFKTKSPSQNVVPDTSESSNDLNLISDDEQIAEQDHDYDVIPTLDGSILVHSNEGMRKTSVTARMLSEQEPYVSDDGLIYTGQRTDRYFGLDLDSGRILHDSMNPDIGRANALSGLGGNVQPRPVRGKSRALVGMNVDSKGRPQRRGSSGQLWIGRTDYTLRAFNERTGHEEFNVTYSELNPIGGKAKSAGLSASKGGNSLIPMGTYHTGPGGGRLAIGDSSTAAAAKQQQPLPLLSTPDGDIFFADGSNGELFSISIGSPAVSAFRLRRGPGGASDIQMLKVAHRMPKTPPGAADASGEEASNNRDSNSDSDDEEGLSGSRTVLVRSLNDGGLYALEIEPDSTLAVVSRGAREYEDFYDSNTSDNESEADSKERHVTGEGEGEAKGGSVPVTANSLLRNKGVVFPGSTDAGGSLRLKDRKLPSMGATVAKLHGHGSNGGNNKASSGASGGGDDSPGMTAGDAPALPGRPVGSHKLTLANSPVVNRLEEELVTAGDRYSQLVSGGRDGDDRDGEGAPIFGGPAEFDKFLQSVEMTQEAEKEKERELDRLRLERHTGLRARFLFLDSILFGNRSGESFSIPMTLLLLLSAGVVLGVGTLTLLLLLMRFNIKLPSVVVQAVYAVLILLLGNSGSIDIAGIKVTASTLLNAADAERLQDVARGLANDLQAETEAKARVEKELQQERQLAEDKRRAEEEPRVESDEYGRQVMVVGSIRITESVLGYGSMGTVVLKGSLNGRPVAVKRMLSQMHRSAEREIALLIKSDGHPNVVRYFLREQKREFVYLALQLCKMSLRDFVTQVQRQQQQQQGGVDEDGRGRAELAPVLRVPQEARMALLQIARGLAHLHSQRIVHRDIKPHNILCALHDEAMENEEKEEATRIAGGGERSDSYEGIGEKGAETEGGAEREDSGKVTGLQHFGRFILKISDMGLSKQLDAGEASFASLSMNASRLGVGGSSSSHLSSHASGGRDPVGTVGWQAPELMAVRNGVILQTSGAAGGEEEEEEEESPLDDATASDKEKDKDKSGGGQTSRKDRRTQTVDVFSLGCVFHYVLVPGEHPFGQWYEREANIMSDKVLNGLRHLESVPDAADLIRRMLMFDQRKRPSSAEVCHHPFFWPVSRRLDFFTELSDLLEHASANKQVMYAIELDAKEVAGSGMNGWGDRLHHGLLDELGRYRKYDFGSVKDLLRVMRNKRHHYLELSQDMQAVMGPMPGGFLAYFEERFPLLLMHCVRVLTLTLSPAHNRSSPEKIFDEYCAPLYSVFATNKADVERLNAPIPTTALGRAATASAGGDGASADDLDLKAYGGTTFEAAVALAGKNGSKSRPWWRPVDEWSQLGGHFHPSAPGTYNTGRNLPSARPSHLTRSSTDTRYRSRLCTHWENSGGCVCPMRKKGKCDFAHGPLELRIKETRRDRWLHNLQAQRRGEWQQEHELVLMRASGGEDVLGAARSIERVRVNEGSVSEFERHSMKSGGSRGMPKTPVSLAYDMAQQQQMMMMQQQQQMYMLAAQQQMHQQQQQLPFAAVPQPQKQAQSPHDSENQSGTKEGR